MTPVKGSTTTVSGVDKVVNILYQNAKKTGIKNIESFDLIIWPIEILNSRQGLICEMRYKLQIFN